MTTSTEDPIGVVLVHRNQGERCARAVEAFSSQGFDVTIFVVDNDSTPDQLAHLPSSVEVLQMGYNAGFGPGANAGLRRWLAASPGEWVVVAPHDAVPEPECLTRLLGEVARRPGVGLASAEFGPEFELAPALDWMIGGYYRPAARGTGWEATDYPHGTLLLARRSALLDVGLFDERYFAYCEEVDLGLRARRRGWQVGLVWGAVVANDRLPDRTVADYLQLRNTLLLIRTHFGRYPTAVRGTYAAGQLVARALGRAPGGWRRRRVEARALVDFARGRFGPPPPSVLAAATAGGGGGGPTDLS